MFHHTAFLQFATSMASGRHWGEVLRCVLEKHSNSPTTCLSCSFQSSNDHVRLFQYTNTTCSCQTMVGDCQLIPNYCDYMRAACSSACPSCLDCDLGYCDGMYSHSNRGCVCILLIYSLLKEALIKRLLSLELD